MSRIGSAVLCVLMAAPCGAIAQEKIKIKIRRAYEVGDRYVLEETEATTVKVEVQDADGKVIQMQARTVEYRSKFEETVLTVEGTKKGKTSRKYERATMKEDGKETDVDLAGNTVTIDRKDGKFVFSLEGGELSDAARRFLEERVKNKDDEKDEDKDAALFGREAVGEGDSWKCDLAFIAKSMLKDEGITLDGTKGTGTGRLKKLYKKDGANFGALRIDLSLPVTGLGKKGDNLKVQSGSSISLGIDADMCVDGTQTTGTYKADIEFKLNAKIAAENGQEQTLTQTVTTKGSETRSPLPKK